MNFNFFDSFHSSVKFASFFYLASLKPTLFLFDHAFMLLTYMLAKLSASLSDSPLMINRISSRS